MGGVFFSESEYALKRITDIFDIIHPIRVSYWHTLSQVHGVKHLYPQVTENQLNASFGVGANIHGVNFKKAFLNCNWIGFEETLAWILLSTLFSIYEGWIESLNKNIFSGNINTSYFQFPQSPTRPIGHIVNVIQNTLQNRSQILEDTLFPVYSAQKHYSFPNLNSLLICFRFFKEMRNCFTHNSSFADHKLVDAYNLFLPIATINDLSVNEVPDYTAPVINTPITISLRGVIGFSAIIVKIITTCDAKLMISSSGENFFVSKLKEFNTPALTLSSSQHKKNLQLISCIKKAGFRAPRNLTGIEHLLRLKRVVF